MPASDTVGDLIEAKVDPTLVDRSGAPKHKLASVSESHGDTKPPAYKPSEDFPTEEELATLVRVAAPIPWKVFTIAFVELVERMSYYGTIVVYNNFIQDENPGTSTGRAPNPKDDNSQPGALGMGQQAAVGISRFNQFWIYIIPILGAWIADTHLGRFKTIVISVTVAEIGHALLTGSAAPGILEKPKNAMALFIVGVIIMGLGTGTFKPNISPLIMEQIPQEILRVEVQKGQRVIVDPAVTATRIYNWFYMFINVGALIGQVAMVYAERYVGFYLAFLIPTVFFLTTLPVLFICNKFYRKLPPSGSVLGPAVKLLFLGMKGRWHLNPIATIRHINDGTYWTNIRPSRLGTAKPRWMVFDDAWVDEVARGWTACGVLLWLPLYWITYNQISDNMVSQAKTMALHGVPNDLLQNLDPLAIIILVPLFDLLVYPFLRKMRIRFTPIKKIFTGFMLGTAAMIWAAVLQHHIYKTSACGEFADKKCKSPINVWAQTGVYVLVAASEIMASVTSLEYAFTKAPKSMRSLVQAFSLFTTAIAAALGQAFVPLSENPKLVWNYIVTALIAFLAGCAFWFTYRDVDKMEDRLNMLPAGGHISIPAHAADLEADPSAAPELVQPDQKA
ncbi:PTR2-domain-containing protein [Lentithecium fluviatile CBS 122367]|uniref:PTR2-domain-containing protein n=1 Tax=Lentithecium fluviatile CBS 122367 TaxID=1168545 RepID=A0A6G1ING6_9PLEO|nr:PTR2-domain-containing protein [Lentithecium fluviatile CBS 122367]